MEMPCNGDVPHDVWAVHQISQNDLILWDLLSLVIFHVLLNIPYLPINQLIKTHILIFLLVIRAPSDRNVVLVFIVRIDLRSYVVAELVVQEEWDESRGSLFRHFLPTEASGKQSKEDEERAKTQRQFINSYFNRSGGETDDHFDPRRIKCDDLGIPQDLSKSYFVMSQREQQEIPHSLSHLPAWLVRHFEYVIRLSCDFFNEIKFKKIRDLRKSQRELPIAERKTEIVDLLKDHQVLIVAGDTGCGKSTQVPQYLLEAGYSGIACTQPRRIACTALARRVAYETLNVYGNEVAYQIRFETTKSKRTKMLFLTEGLLLRQMENDSLLQQYNVIILDEVHERHLSSDLLIGLLRDLVEKRPDLKLILMSATINLALFSDYFQGAPVIEVPGRLYPIQLQYHPIKQFIAEAEKKNHKIDPEPYLRILEKIDKETPSNQRGDVLIFLNGVAEIETVAQTLKTYAELTKGWIILLLHSTLSVDEQDKVFDIAPLGSRKCILSTNIAETSVTIDGIRFVIDSGKASRAGRTGPGICYRLYSQEQFDKMDDFTPSEIHRVSLQDMTLRMISLNLGLDPRTFPFIERPAEDALDEALEKLKFQGVLYSDRENQLTALGNAVAKLPMDVSIAKMLIYGCVVDQFDVMLTVAAGLSVQSPFTNRSFREPDTVEKRAPLTSPMGDPFTLIALFREWVLQKAYGGKAKRWTIENGLDEHRLQILEESGFIEKPTAEELGEDDSRQRRIEQGEKRKLFEMKRAARNKEKSRKVLRAEKHFDTILDERVEEEIEAETDIMKTDVKTVEFLLSHKQRDVDVIRSSHKLRRKEAEIIRLVIACGLYPNYSLLDPANKYQQGQEIYSHSRLKPFTQIHPNSSLVQYHLHTLNAQEDSQNYSNFHQIPFYGMLLETTKPYVCNVMPVPALYALIVAKKVICEDWKLVTVDDFVEIQFKSSNACREVIDSVIQIKKELKIGLTSALEGDKLDMHRLARTVDKFSRYLTEEGVVIGLKRLVSPPRILEDVGFFTPDGEVKIDDDKQEEGAEEVQESEAEREERQRLEEEDRAVRQFLGKDPMCPMTREMIEEEEEIAENKKKPEKKESYYEKLLKAQKEREEKSRMNDEGQEDTPTKRQKVEAKDEVLEEE
ncbi:hypothetical protein WR25_20485 [Diploscapter pachys]|uniref:Helicase ATP-binding domain-containing protein n=1 Tax=Diploscapter pachys TaxID=2018661 RepID=A0A2A2JRS3_9BILA|nr:hypothetical protein WR25_20485 [Diploscapter pachys]